MAPACSPTFATICSSSSRSAATPGGSRSSGPESNRNPARSTTTRSTSTETCWPSPARSGFRTGSRSSRPRCPAGTSTTRAATATRMLGAGTGCVTSTGWRRRSTNSPPVSFRSTTRSDGPCAAMGSAPGRPGARTESCCARPSRGPCTRPTRRSGSYRRDASS